MGRPLTPQGFDGKNETRDLIIIDQESELLSSGFGTTIQESVVMAKSHLPSSSEPLLPSLHDVSSAGKFELRSILDKGGTGEVWRAYQRTLRRTIAVKRIKKSFYTEYSGNPERLRDKELQFQLEALLTAQLDHPFILPIYELGEDEDKQPLIAMKLLHGRNWQEKISLDHEKFSEHQFLHHHLPIFVDMAKALAFAHDRGIIHRDLKPSQVMIGKYGEVVLMDWGLAVVVDETPENPLNSEVLGILPNKLTAPNPAGTPCLMAPEQAEESAENIGRHTDIFLLGALLYYLLTGHTIHMGSTVSDLLMKASACRIIPVHDRAEGRMVPGGLADLTMRCLKKDPKERPKTVDEVIREVRRYLAGDMDRRQALDLIEKARSKLESIGDNTASGVAHSIQPNRSKKRSLIASDVRYTTYSECLSLVDRATVLWPHNAQIPEVRHRIAHGYVTAAIQANDLMLARAILRRIDSPEVICELSHKIEVAEIRQLRRDRQRYIALAAVVFLLLTLVGGGVKYVIDQSRSQLDAVEARFDAERMVSFMIENLHDDLKSVGQLRILEKVANRAVDYYQALPSKGMDDESLANHALSLRILGDVRTQQGKLDEAIDLYLKALELRELLPTLNRYQLEKSLDHTSLGEAYKREAKMEVALHHFQRAEKYIDSLDSSGLPQREYLFAKSNILGQIGSIRLAYGENEKARDLFNKQLSIRQKLAEQFPMDTEIINSLATSRVQISWTYANNVDMVAQYLANLSEAVSIRRSVAIMDPIDFRHKLSLAATLHEYSLAQYASLDYAGAQVSNQDSIQLLLDLNQSDPSNHDYLGRLSDAYRSRYRFLAETDPGNPDLTYLSMEAESIMRNLMAIAPKDKRWALRLSMFLRERIAMDPNPIDNDHYVTDIEEAIAIQRDLLAQEPRNRQMRNVIILSQLVAGELFHDRKEFDRAHSVAEEALNSAVRIYEEYPALSEQKDLVDQAIELLSKIPVEQ